MLLAAESETHEAVAVAAGWFLENAWLIPVIPAVAFFLIILFGKKTPGKGAPIGIAALLGSFVLAAGAVVQWIDRVGKFEGTEGEHALTRFFGQGLFKAAEEGGEHHAAPYVTPVIKQWTWWSSGNHQFTIGIHVDGLSIMLMVLVSFIATLVLIYSTEYVKGDRRYTHFFAALCLFASGMLTMVVAESTVLLLLGWEIMGLCSFMLIGHWWEEYPNARAALKAFFTVRTGDVGLLVGLAILYFSSNDWIRENMPGNDGFSIQGIMAWAQSGEGSHNVMLWASIALLIAAIGKSGQFPLHTWLPDAMAGPTPVSSLLHSSTMVVAGVFLVARLYPVFYEGFSIGDSALNPLALIGGITILISGFLALVQHDIKKVLAYSTVGQLGYMMMGLGVGAWLPAVFHIFTHAFFKACLFLGAGSVAHSGSHHSFDMRKDMGGLRKHMPITFITFLISTLALTGVPFLAGFFSKDEIIDNAGHNGYEAFMVIGLVGAFFTTAYMSRCVYLTFFGTPRGAAAGEHHDEHDAHDVHTVAAHGHDDHGHDAHGADAHGHDAHGAHDDHGAHGPHESPLVITIPLIILSIGAVFAGYLNAVPPPFEWHWFKDWVEPGGEGEFFPILSHAEFKWSKAMISIVIVLAAYVIAFALCRMVYEQRKWEGLTQRSKPARWIYNFLWNKYYLDHLYEKVVVRGIVGPIAKGAYWINQNVLDGVINGVGRGGVQTGRWVYRNIDQKVVDHGLVDGSGKASAGTGGLLRGLQTGKVQQYGALLFGAAAVGALVLLITVSGS